VGPGPGVISQAVLAAGIRELHLFEADGEKAKLLRRRFENDTRVVVHEGDGLDLTALGADEIPRRIGIVKIDPSGAELATIRMLLDVEPEIVAVGCRAGAVSSAWSPTEMVATLHDRGFLDFGFVGRRGGRDIIRWQDAALEDDDVGALVFLGSRTLGHSLAAILEFAIDLDQGPAVDRVVRELCRHAAAADDRLEAIEELLTDIRALQREREVVASAASERLDALKALEREREYLMQVAAERLALIEELSRAHREVEQIPQSVTDVPCGNRPSQGAAVEGSARSDENGA
jgi:hypothetical protein